MTDNKLAKLGFKFGKCGAHSARSMMISELSTLIELQSENPSLQAFKSMIIDLNALHKSTANSRKLTCRNLIDLYSLDLNVCLFRNLLVLWKQTDTDRRPLLALQLAFCRDPLLRLMLPVLGTTKAGESFSKEQTIELLEQHNPGGYSPASLDSFARNINGSLTQAGFLQGKIKKTRSQPGVGASNVAFALFIAHLNGEDGSIALKSQWVKLLGLNQDEIVALAHSAHSRGLIKFTHAGEVVEIRFPDWLTEHEKEILNG